MIAVWTALGWIEGRTTFLVEAEPLITRLEETSLPSRFSLKASAGKVAPKVVAVKLSALVYSNGRVPVGYILLK